MKKEIYLVFLYFCFLFSLCFSQEEKTQKYPQIDGDLKFYLPSLLGTVTGNNAVFAQEDYESVDSCLNFICESRVSFLSIGKTTFSASFGMGFYTENDKTITKDVTSMQLTFGLGSYFHIFESPTFPLNGLCLYLYPVYQIPVYKRNYEPYLKWKMAFDLGYNLTLLETVTIYPYMRNIIGWNSNDFRYGLDFGIAVGIYFQDRNY